MKLHRVRSYQASTDGLHDTYHRDLKRGKTCFRLTSCIQDIHQRWLLSARQRGAGNIEYPTGISATIGRTHMRQVWSGCIGRMSTSTTISRLLCSSADCFERPVEIVPRIYAAEAIKVVAFEAAGEMLPPNDIVIQPCQATWLYELFAFGWGGGIITTYSILLFDRIRKASNVICIHSNHIRDLL
jgi:hypothetical protein